MAEGGVLRIYLDAPALGLARSGRHLFVNRVRQALEAQGIRSELRPDTLVERLAAETRGGWSMAHMTSAPGPRGFTFRKLYHAPFWQIDRHAERWKWRSARAVFDARSIDPAVALAFAQHWRQRLFDSRTPGPPCPSQDGYLFAPLQGCLVEHRSFQSASPIDMLGEVLVRLPGRQVVARLHPRETYTARELAALDALRSRFPQLHLSDRDATELLAGCAGVVTENSALAFSGYFLHKPALLFAEIDFHHIAASVPRDGLDEAVVKFSSGLPDFDAYLWWFLHEMALNARRADVGGRVLAAFRAGGWQV